MKICQRCGRKYTDDNMFCETCGARLTPQIQSQDMQDNFPAPEKKNAMHPLIYLIPVAAAIVLVALLFLFWAKLPFSSKEDGVKKTSQQGEESHVEGEGSEEKKDSSQTATEKEGKKEQDEGQEPEGSQKGKEAKEDYADAQINGVDNAYVQVAGTVAKENGILVLKLEKPASVCAYDAEDKIAQKESVGAFELDGDGMEE